jgi:hypothetical protein
MPLFDHDDRAVARAIPGYFVASGRSVRCAGWQAAQAEDGPAGVIDACTRRV